MNPTPACDWPRFDRQLATTALPLPLFRQQLAAANDNLQQRFFAGEPVERLVSARAELMDQLLVRAWHRQVSPDATDIALVAVGGYGRHELHPGSDIDLLILLSEDDTAHDYAGAIEHVLLFLWDLKLEVGQSVRSVDECTRQAEQDITVATNLMEARLLSGPQDLFQAMKKAAGPDRVWPSADFFRAKIEEQQTRHHRFHDSGYNLEPNIKESPGGLRDLQVIGWVAKRHFGAKTLHDLVGHDFLTEHEYQALNEAQNFLWKVRCGLHYLTGRREDRLLFEHQRKLAAQFGYHDQTHSMAVEQFMKDYYRTVLRLSRLNEMLLQLFEEEILLANVPGEPQPLSMDFQARHGYLEAVSEDIFLRRPTALLELFVLMARHPELRGVRAGTIRLVRDHRYQIDDNFRRDPKAHALFIELFRQGTGLTHELRRMNRYGVLAAYLPVFGHIVGQMQHDLFHIYTVDEHTMFVVRNLRRFTVAEFHHEFPLCSDIIQRIKKQEVLTLAGFFHDIGKGRGGDHSLLGAADAVVFCRDHGMGEYDTELVKWLVENHLIMSTTAQRKDISDPEVISEFAQRVGSQKRLDHLYLLTVADIRATSDSLWNSWKDALLADLYRTTSRALRRGLDNPVAHQDLVRETRAQALGQLTRHGCSEMAVQQFWQRLNTDYFLRHSAEEIAWQTRSILDKPEGDDEAMVRAWGRTHRGGTEIFVYAQDRESLFATITATLEQLGLNIIDARVVTSCNQYALDTFLVLDHNDEAITDPQRLEEIQQRLKRQLAEPGLPSQQQGQLSRQQRHFPIATEVWFRDDRHNRRTIMEVTTGDRPGLLARLARALLECNVLLQSAKIATFGERAEDIFFVTNSEQQPLDTPQFDCLRAAIKRLLED
ncbi:MAG TPA: [protein-PII] uridylyltransferase [Gammaproteobacteria bacterium]|nr:[protein-PII] uridylyltransferase [Gammaproteobacteria bacterium]